jgi:hypothetical protein
MGVGTERNGGNTSPLLISIQIGDRMVVSQSGGAVGAEVSTPVTDLGPGGRKSEEAEKARTPAHAFFPKVSPARVSEVLDLDVEPESVSGIENHGSVENLDL